MKLKQLSLLRRDWDYLMVLKISWLIASLVEKVKVDLALMIYGYGINKRLGTSNLIIGKLGYAAVKKGK